MDLLSFRSLHDSCERIDAAERIERMSEIRHAYHMEGRAFVKYIKNIIKENMPDMRTEGNTDDFLARYGKGF